MTRFITILFAILTSLAALAGDSISYIPKFHGTLRPRWEVLTGSGENKASIRNACVTVGGNAAPFCDYYVYADLCDDGKFQLLDGWARVRPDKNSYIQMGQMRMPFAVDAFRAPHTFYFANRSFMVAQMCNYRAIGLKGGYEIPRTPFNIEAGVFTPTPIGHKIQWRNGVAYSFKGVANFDSWQLATGFLSVNPWGIRGNMADAAVTWERDRWIVESEYMYCHYVGNPHKPTHVWNAFANYRFPVKFGWFNYMSFQGRFDGITSVVNLMADETGEMKKVSPPHNRITVGVTITHMQTASIFLDLRINYENYFYHHGAIPDEGRNNKLVAELVARF